jgi:hypothetical protein
MTLEERVEKLEQLLHRLCGRPIEYPNSFETIENMIRKIIKEELKK